MAGGGPELTGVDLAGKLEKGPGVLPEVLDVEHGVRVGQVRKVYCQPKKKMPGGLQ